MTTPATDQLQACALHPRHHAPLFDQDFIDRACERMKANGYTAQEVAAARFSIRADAPERFPVRGTASGSSDRKRAHWGWLLQQTYSVRLIPAERNKL
jgi:hypothetical protein